MTSQVGNEIYQGVKKLIDQQTQGVNNKIIRFGTIAPDYAGGQPRVYFDGEDSSTSNSGTLVTCIDSHTPAAGERVTMIGSGSQWIILGGTPGTAMGYNGVSVTNYGAKGDGQTDDTKAFQAALDAVHQLGGGTVHIPQGKYVISIEERNVPWGTEKYGIFVYSNTRLVGAGAGALSVKSPDNTTDPAYFGWDSLALANNNPAEIGGVTELVCSDLEGSVIMSINTRFVTMEHFKVTGPGRGRTDSEGEANTTNGIRFGYENLDPMVEWDGTSVPFYINVSYVHTQGFGGDGFHNQTICVATWRNCIASEINGAGFHHPEGSTSNNYQGCWARNCTVGWKFKGSIYISLNGCAADYCNVSYWVSDAQTIGFYGCGSEFPLDAGTDFASSTLMGGVAGYYRGYSWRFDQNSNCCTVSSCEVIGNPYRGILYTDGAQMNTFIGVADNGPMDTAEYFFVAGANTKGTLINVRLSTISNYAVGSVINELDNNQGSAEIGYDATIKHDLRVNNDAFMLKNVYIGSTAGAPETDCRLYRYANSKIKTDAYLISDGLGATNIEPTTPVPGGWGQNGRLAIYDGTGTFVGYIPVYT